MTDRDLGRNEPTQPPPGDGAAPETAKPDDPLRQPGATSGAASGAAPDVSSRETTPALSAATVQPVPPADAPAPPERIGPYRVVRRLGEGGMGSVYLAEQDEPIRRLVAVKVVKAGFGGGEILNRFRSERQALARMDHPHIAHVLDAGATEAGEPYFAMEYVPGVPLTTFADRQGLTVRQRLELFCQVCDAVAHAHTKAILHRDLKPHNVLGYLHDGRPFAKVIDFGIAKAIGPERLTDVTLVTDAGLAIGTYEYMSPEQAEGSTDIDTRTDVYSLGVMLYELLTGALPFDRRQLKQAARQAAERELIRLIREAEPPRPSTKLSGLQPETAGVVAAARGAKPDTLVRQLRAELEWIPLKAMRKEPHRRYRSPLQLADDLRNYLEGRPLIAGPESRAYRARKFVRRHRLPVGAAAAVVAVAVAGVVLYVRGIRAEQRKTEAALVQAETQRQEAERQRAEAVRQRGEAERQAAVAQAVSRFQTEMLGSADPERLLGDKVTVLQATQAAVKELDDGKLHDQPLVEAAVREMIGQTLMNLGRYDDAEPNLRRARELLQSAPHAQPWDLAAALSNLGTLFKHQGKFDDADAMYVRALEVFRGARPPGHIEVGFAINNLGLLRWSQGRLPEAEALLREALATYQMADPPVHERHIAECLNNLAAVLKDAGRIAEAAPLQQEVLTIYRQVWPANHPQIARTLNNLAVLAHRQGNLPEAEAKAREALAIYRQALPPEHPELLACLSNLAAYLQMQGKLTDAEPVIREVLALRRKLLPSRHPSLGMSLNNLGMLLLARGKAAEAEPAFAEALSVFRAALPPGHAHIAACLNNLANALKEQGKLADAEPLYRESLAIYQEGLGPDHPDTIDLLTGCAQVLRRLHRAADAEPLAREAMERGRRVLPEPAATNTVNEYVSVLVELGRDAQAEPLARDALDRAATQPSLGPDHRLTLSLARQLHAIQLRLKKPADAAATARRFRMDGPATATANP